MTPDYGEGIRTIKHSGDERQILDEGNLIFPRIKPLPFLKEVNKNVCEFGTDTNLAK